MEAGTGKDGVGREEASDQLRLIKPQKYMQKQETYFCSAKIHF